MSGCGSGGETSEAERPATAPAAAADGGDAEEVATSEAAVERAFDEFQAAFTAGRGAETCSALAPSGLREIAAVQEAFPNVPDGATCAETIEALIAAADAAGTEQQPAKATSATIRGRRATAMVSDAGRPPQPVELVLVDGRWKLATAGFAGLLGGG